jgi:AraC-like DNA-binding protein
VQIENLIKNRELLLKSYHERPLATISSLASSTIDNEFLNILTTYIDKNLTNENLSVDMIANELNMSNSSLYRKVKGISGLSPVDFIRICRLKKAIQLMEEGKKEKRNCLFSWILITRYFSSSFQKQYG